MPDTRHSLTRRSFLLAPALAAASAAEQPPNLVVIFTDDQGYSDLGVYGAEGFATPRIDRMAAEGARFTDFYAAAPVCSPSRAALLTGRYPVRVGIPGVLGANSRAGISPDEVLLPELLKTRGYRTALYGKWHLGSPAPFHPMRHGFDEFFGTPGSNDMGSNMDLEARRQGKAGVQLYDGERVVEVNPDQSRFTARYTERAVRFIRENRERPFFLYLAHNMPHTPIFASPKFRGRTKRGLYGDVVEEIDWSVGQVLDTLRREGLDGRTLVVFSSDNGPWLIFGDHGGSARPLRGGKREVGEGGFRVPAIFRWPGRIPAGRVCREVATNMDVFPTFARLAGARLPDRTIDGRDIWPLVAGVPGARSPHEVFYYYYMTELRACRSGKWKLWLPHTDEAVPDPARVGNGGVRGEVRAVKYGLALYDLEADPGETTDVAARNPSVVRRLQALAERAREDLGDSVTGRRGRDARKPVLLG